MIERGRWMYIRRRPVLFAALIYLIGNIISAISMGGIHPFGLLVNMLPTMIVYYIAAADKEERIARKATKNDLKA